jgi:hypothetical protein
MHPIIDHWVEAAGAAVEGDATLKLEDPEVEEDGTGLYATGWTLTGATVAGVTEV